MAEPVTIDIEVKYSVLSNQIVFWWYVYGLLPYFRESSQVARDMVKVNRQCLFLLLNCQCIPNEFQCTCTASSLRWGLAVPCI